MRAGAAQAVPVTPQLELITYSPWSPILKMDGVKQPHNSLRKARVDGHYLLWGPGLGSSSRHRTCIPLATEKVVLTLGCLPPPPSLQGSPWAQPENCLLSTKALTGSIRVMSHGQQLNSLALVIKSFASPSQSERAASCCQAPPPTELGQRRAHFTSLVLSFLFPYLSSVCPGARGPCEPRLAAGRKETSLVSEEGAPTQAPPAPNPPRAPLRPCRARPSQCNTEGPSCGREDTPHLVQNAPGPVLFLLHQATPHVLSALLFFSLWQARTKKPPGLKTQDSSLQPPSS